MDLDDVIETLNNMTFTTMQDDMIKCLAKEVKNLKDKVQELVYTKADDPNYNPMEE